MMLEVRHDGITALGGNRTLVQSYFDVARHDEGLPADQRFRLPDSMEIGLAVWDDAVSRIYRDIDSVLQAEACRHLNGHRVRR